MLVLGAHNFEAATERFILMLILLHTPGCDGCTALMEEYVQASDELYEHLIPVAKVGLRGGELGLVVSAFFFIWRGTFCSQPILD